MWYQNPPYETVSCCSYGFFFFYISSVFKTPERQQEFLKSKWKRGLLNFTPDSKSELIQSDSKEDFTEFYLRFMQNSVWSKYLMNLHVLKHVVVFFSFLFSFNRVQYHHLEVVKCPCPVLVLFLLMPNQAHLIITSQIEGDRLCLLIMQWVSIEWEFQMVGYHIILHEICKV